VSRWTNYKRKRTGKGCEKLRLLKKKLTVVSNHFVSGATLRKWGKRKVVGVVCEY
jgi:hypothetical protein